MEIKLLLYEGDVIYVTAHIQSQAAANYNHFNYLQYIFLRTQVVKDFFFVRKYILAVPWVHFPDGLLLLLHDLVSAFIPQSQSLLQRFLWMGRTTSALVSSLAVPTRSTGGKSASMYLARTFWLLSGLINFEQQICFEFWIW